MLCLLHIDLKPYIQKIKLCKLLLHQLRQLLRLFPADQVSFSAKALQLLQSFFIIPPKIFRILFII